MASFVLVLSATLEQKPRDSPRNSQASSPPWPPWQGTSACPSFVTTSCLEVRGFVRPWSHIMSHICVCRWSRLLSSCTFTWISWLCWLMEMNCSVCCSDFIFAHRYSSHTWVTTVYSACFKSFFFIISAEKTFLVSLHFKTKKRQYCKTSD